MDRFIKKVVTKFIVKQIYNVSKNILSPKKRYKYIENNLKLTTLETVNHLQQLPFGLVLINNFVNCMLRFIYLRFGLLFS